MQSVLGNGVYIEKIKYNSLPYGKPLTNTELPEDIPQIFARPKKHSDKLSQLGSTQSMKVLIGLWLPKDLMHIFTADPLGKGLLLA